MNPSSITISLQRYFRTKDSHKIIISRRVTINKIGIDSEKKINFRKIDERNEETWNFNIINVQKISAMSRQKNCACLNRLIIIL